VIYGTPWYYFMFVPSYVRPRAQLVGPGEAAQPAQLYIAACAPGVPRAGLGFSFVSCADSQGGKPTS